LVCFQDDWGFKQGVHIFSVGLKPSGNHKAPLPAKFDQVRLDGEMDNSPGLAFAPDIIDTRDEFAERQRFLPAITFHA
jgi:hypothetical protein